VSLTVLLQLRNPVLEE